MAVGKARDNTARARRALIIRTLEENLGRPDADVIVRLRSRLARPHSMIVGSDIDGLLSAMMLSSVSDWRIAAIVKSDGSVLLSRDHKDLPDLIARDDVFGVDIFSSLFPTISNHPVLFGSQPRSRPEWLRAATDAFDDAIRQSCKAHGSINLSIWAGIGARLDEESPRGLPYKYPLGTGQLTLAVLELAGSSPRFYDREYLPWLIADCDGGLDSIREYHWNVEVWWSALAAVVGPASLSESIYQIAHNQRATQFVDVDLRLRRDYKQLAEVLNADWNLSGEDVATLVGAAKLVSDVSGWPDPFIGGAEQLDSWRTISPTRNVLYLRAITKQEQRKVELHLTCAREAIHVNFARFFEKGTYLGWMLPKRDAEVERRLGAPPDVNFLREAPALGAEDEQPRLVIE